MAAFAGLTTAYLLARAGKRVAVLDDGPIGGGMTSGPGGGRRDQLPHQRPDLEPVDAGREEKAA